MLSATFHDRGSVADDPDFSVNLSRSRANFHGPEILYIFRRNCYTSQVDADSSFPYGVAKTTRCMSWSQDQANGSWLNKKRKGVCYAQTTVCLILASKQPLQAKQAA